MAKKWNIPFLGSPELVGDKFENTPMQLYKLIKPFTTDPDTGEVLNPTSEPKLVKAGTRDLQEEIQSYRDTSLYSVLEKVAFYNDTITGEEPELNVKKGAYDVDITGLPDNINDVSQYLNNEKNIKTPDKAGSQGETAHEEAQSKTAATSERKENDGKDGSK